jgi:hypothetical protein
MCFISLLSLSQYVLASLGHLQVRDSHTVSLHAHAVDVSSGNCASWKKRKFNGGKLNRRGECLDEAMGGEGTGGVQARKFSMTTDNLLHIANEYRTILPTERAFAINLDNDNVSLCRVPTTISFNWGQCFPVSKYANWTELRTKVLTAFCYYIRGRGVITDAPVLWFLALISSVLNEEN